MGTRNSKPGIENVSKDGENPFKIQKNMESGVKLSDTEYKNWCALFLPYEIKVSSGDLSYATAAERNKVMDIFSEKESKTSKSFLDTHMNVKDKEHLVLEDRNLTDDIKNAFQALRSIFHDEIPWEIQLEIKSATSQKCILSIARLENTRMFCTCIAQFKDVKNNLFYVAMYLTLQNSTGKAWFRNVTTHEATECGFLHLNCKPAAPAASGGASSFSRPSAVHGGAGPSSTPPAKSATNPGVTANRKPTPTGPKAGNAGKPASGPGALVNRSLAKAQNDVLVEFGNSDSKFLHDIGKHNRELSAHVVNEQVEGTHRYMWSTVSTHYQGNTKQNSFLQQSLEHLINVLYDVVQQNTELSKMLSRCIMLMCGVDLQDHFVLDCRNLKFTNYTVVHGHDSMYAIFRDKPRTSYTIVYAGNLRPVDGLLQHQELLG